jgi:hypothetical protein
VLISPKILGGDGNLALAELISFLTKKSLEKFINQGRHLAWRGTLYAFSNKQESRILFPTYGR